MITSRDLINQCKVYKMIELITLLKIINQVKVTDSYDRLDKFYCKFSKDIDNKDFKNMGHVKVNSIVKEYEKKLQNIVSDSDKFYLVNAGRMNHGKSSLLNSLTGKIDDFFEVQDRRTTVKNKEYEYDKNVYFIDTPGLNAHDKDDREAIKAYKKANLILFVHNLSVGDIRKEEINDLNTILSCFNDVNSLANKFILVLTGKDLVQSKDDLEAIKSKILFDIKNEIGIEDFKVFEISNTRYKKGLMTNKDALVKLSGVVELHNYIDQYITNYQIIENERIIERIDLLTLEYKKLLELKANNMNKLLEKREKEIIQYKERILSILETRFYLIQNIMKKISICESQIKLIKDDM